ncbi:MAG: hypothetical protein LC109_13645 [Bacteroidia bacterium]|nr:hypothetical protein [Bacteroidia bacterium]MCO5254945.1 hypothetical protein [Bacteroidota bacterium]MCZ2131293.1 hypothetical protein [Bacteroidia bacterium]
MKNKPLIIGIITGILAPLLCCIVVLYARFPQYMSVSYIVDLWLGNDKTALPIIKASMLINLPIFLIALNRFKNQKFARGVVVGTLLIGAYIFIIHFFK